MKSFFDRATQRIYEAFNGPKVVDHEFDEKVNEMINSEKGMLQFKELFLSMENNFNGIRNHARLVCSSLKSIYEGNKNYELVIKEITQVHSDIDVQIMSFFKSMSEVRSMTEEWNGLFVQAKILVEDRVKWRREYEHYDEKMEDMMKERSKDVNYDIDKYNRVRFFSILRMNKNINL